MHTPSIAPTTVILDAGGVLLFINETRNQVFRRVLCSKGMTLAAAEAAIATLIPFDRNFFAKHGQIVDWDDEKHWLQSRCQHLALTSALPQKDLAEQLMHLSLDTYQYRLYDDTLAALALLQQHFELHVLSNATATLDWAFDYLDIRKFFGEVIISAYERCAKPDLTIYHRCLQRINSNAEECLFIDDRAENVAAANRVGMHAILLDRSTGDNLLSLSKRLQEASA